MRTLLLGAYFSHFTFLPPKTRLLIPPCGPERIDGVLRDLQPDPPQRRRFGKITLEVGIETATQGAGVAGNCRHVPCIVEPGISDCPRANAPRRHG